MKRGNRILIFGGTFNPLHNGHLRLAIEASSVLGACIDSTVLMPAKIQPLKNPGTMLPYEWRCKMVSDALADLLNYECSMVEGRRDGPSYTYETLRNYPDTSSREERFFLLGSEDFAQLGKWHKGLELPDVCNMVVAPRGDFGLTDFEQTLKKLWPGKLISIIPVEDRLNNSRLWQATLHNGGKIFYISIPYLEISSTYIRFAWLRNENVAFLMPDSVLRFMNLNRKEIMAWWQERSS